MFALALAKWAPAIRVSSLRFAPDSACVQEPCLCSEPGLGEETLQIILSDEDGGGPSSSLGYRPPTVDVGYEPGLPRHYLPWPTEQKYHGLDAPLSMAHELGAYIK